MSNSHNWCQFTWFSFLHDLSISYYFFLVSFSHALKWIVSAIFEHGVAFFSALSLFWITKRTQFSSERKSMSVESLTIDHSMPMITTNTLLYIHCYSFSSILLHSLHFWFFILRQSTSTALLYPNKNVICLSQRNWCKLHNIFHTRYRIP